MVNIPIAILLLVTCSLLEGIHAVDDRNPFYISTENKENDYSWKFGLLNHHSGSAGYKANNPELLSGNLLIESVDAKVLHLKINNASGVRWEAIMFNKNPGRDYQKALMKDMSFAYDKDPFTFTVRDSSDNQAILLTNNLSNGGSLKFFDKYIELGLWYPSKRMSGLGERSTPDFEL